MLAGHTDGPEYFVRKALICPMIGRKEAGGNVRGPKRDCLGSGPCGMENDCSLRCVTRNRSFPAVPLCPKAVSLGLPRWSLVQEWEMLTCTSGQHQQRVTVSFAY